MLQFISNLKENIFNTENCSYMLERCETYLALLKKMKSSSDDPFVKAAAEQLQKCGTYLNDNCLPIHTVQRAATYLPYIAATGLAIYGCHLLFKNREAIRQRFTA